VTTLSYNSAGLVERIADPFGRQALFGYDSDRNLVSLTDAVGYTTQVEYGPNWMIKALVNGGGRTEFLIERPTTTLLYLLYPKPGGDMGKNSRITVTHPNGGKEEFYYNGMTGSPRRAFTSPPSTTKPTGCRPFIYYLYRRQRRGAEEQIHLSL
jgi:uncharacterized protein RhaS with RHS repeats